MNIIKIILGAVIGIASAITLIESLGNDKGFGLLGGIIAFILTGGLSYWLINSSLKEIHKNK